jgi:hypothetical protein
MMLFKTKTKSPCWYCGLDDEKVEAGGIYYCPNIFCFGCGATNSKIKEGYIDADGSASDKQINRMIEECEKAFGEAKQDSSWRTALYQSLRKLNGIEY